MTDVERRVRTKRSAVTESPVEEHPPAPSVSPGPPWTPPAPVRLALLSGLLYVPFVWLGYGTDIDITNVLRSGESILEGDYRYSRPPGAFPHELVTGVLDRLGGAVLVNLGSVSMAVLTLAMLARVVERSHGPRAGRIAVVVVATQPWFWVAASSLGDYLYALALLLVGVDASQRDARVLASIAFGLSIGFRAATALLVAAYLLARVTGSAQRGRGAEDPRFRRQALTVGTAAALIALVCFVPPWLSVGRTTRFLDNQLQAGDFLVMLARWGVKNVAFFGLVAIVLLAARLPVLLAPLRRFGESELVRFAVFAAVVTELLYLRFPWKPVHLLPAAVCLAILLAVSPRTSNRLVVGVVVAHLVLALVSVSIAEPDVADAATTGHLAPGITRGVAVNEVVCRLGEDFVVDFDGDWPDLDTATADYAAIGVFACQARSWRAGQGPEVPGGP